MNNYFCKDKFMFHDLNFSTKNCIVKMNMVILEDIKYYIFEIYYLTIVKVI